MRYLGAHVFAFGGKESVFKIADQAGANAIQTMPTAPMRWATKDVPEDTIHEFIKGSVGTGVKKFLTHGIYLINLGRKDKQLFHLSKMSVVTYLNYMSLAENFAAELNPELEVLGVTFHPGSAKDLTQEEALARVTYGLNWILEQSPSGSILLESSAGAGSVLGDTLEELAKMKEGVEQKERIGFVLDTQHMWASGYDWINDLDNVVDQIDSVLGLENVKCFHLNDSATELASHKDRHADLGEGEIGVGLANVVNHPKLKDAAFVMETPSLKTQEGLGEQMRVLK